MIRIDSWLCPVVSCVIISVEVSSSVSQFCRLLSSTGINFIINHKRNLSDLGVNSKMILK
jgi:hypothetical protein